MDERMKHRLIGIIVIVSILMILAPIVLKTTEPSWHTLHRRGEFQMPAKPKPLPVMIVKKPATQWQAPSDIKTTDLDKKPPVKLTLKAVKPLPVKTHLENLPEVVIKRPVKDVLPKKAVVKKPQRPVVHHKIKRRHVRATKKVAIAHQRHQYHVQVATFSSERNALNVQQRLHKMGMRSMVKLYKNKQGRQFYQVHLLDSYSKEQAKRISIQMKKRFKVNSLIRRG